ncbi:hypothetical protein Bbelb_331570 [Branchiostoma belcheri]|nr:hypothetical protein Bbelb_331570 [Branchiostoma belcheri]
MLQDGDTALQVACILGKVRVVELLTKDRTDLNVTEKDRDALLHAACREGNEKVVELLIKNQADLNVTDWTGDTGLHVACGGGHVKVVELLIKNQADLNVTNKNGDTALQVACRLGRVAVVELLTKDRTDLNVTEKDRDVLLHAACREGNVKVVELLIKNQADLNVTDWGGDTGLHVACRWGHDNVMKLLIKNQADLNVTNGYGNTGLHLACRGGHDNVVELLIKNQADLNVTNRTGDTALHLACRGGHDNVVELLIKNQADLNVTNRTGDTALHLACRGGHDNVVELLIKNQADLNTGDTGLHVACGGGHVKVVELLIKNQADLNVTNKNGDTALQVACRLGRVAVVELLTKDRTDLNVTEKDRDALLHAACREGNEKVVELLIKNQADLNVTDENGDTGLHVACRGGHDKVVELFIKNQADLNMTNKTGDTALHIACSEGNVKVVELLIKNQADLNMTNKNGDTLLHAACKGGNFNVVELLIKNQADLNVTDKTGDTALHVACRGGNGEVVGLLIRNRADLLITNKTETRKQAEYGELVSSLGSEEETTVKLFLSGDGEVGKTSLRAILKKTGFFMAVLWNIRKKFRKDEFSPTPGVHVSRKHVKGIGRLSLHDFAGQAQFYVTHAMLLRTTNAIFPVVYKITDGEEEQKRQACSLLVHGWLSFINCSNPDPTNMPRVVLIASHADKIHDKIAGQRRAKAMVEHYRNLFEGAMVVSPEVFLMNCLEAESADIRRLRDVLAAFKEDMLEERQAIPKVCVQLTSNLAHWREERQTFPVLQWEEYLAVVQRDISVSLAERTVQLASSYLHDIGEWLYTSVFGILLAPDNFPIDNIQRTAEDHVTYEELKRVFGDVADIPLLIKLLQDFQLCHTFDGQTFILPSLLQQEMDDRAWSPVSGKAVYFGVQIRCRTEIDSFSCDLFPRLQTLLMQAHPDKLSQPLLWKNSAKCTDGKAEALLQIAQDKRRLNIFVRSNDGDREDCNSIMDLLADMAYKLLHETSPGARSQDMVLSALDLREHSPQPHAYSREEVVEAAAKGENVVHPQRKVPEKVKDLLLHLGNVKGMLGRVARKRPQLVETLSPIINVTMDHLRADDVISLEENARIRATRTRSPQDAARELLDMLEAKGEQACVLFHSALTKVDQYAASILE